MRFLTLCRGGGRSGDESRENTGHTQRSGEQQFCPDTRQERKLHVLITRVCVLSDNYSSAPTPRWEASEDGALQT